jgi:hypothetical protein
MKNSKPIHISTEKNSLFLFPKALYFQRNKKMNFIKEKKV